MINSTFDKIEKVNIDSLVANAVRESKTLEYKEVLPGGRDEDKKEFLADVSSFANASGGDIVYGIVELRDIDGKPTGIPERAPGLEAINGDIEVRRLESIIRDGLDPRIPGVQLKAIDGFPKGQVVVVRVPQSWAAPHMVVFKASPRFFTRTSAGKSPLDVQELRAAFASSESMPEKIRRFRDGRLGKILAGETPWPLETLNCCVLHVVPYEAMLGKQLLDPLKFTSGGFFISRPNGISGYDRLNLDGYVALCTGSDLDGPAFGYSQVFRQGAIEFVDSYHLRPRADTNDHRFPATTIENFVFSGTNSAIELFEKADVLPPYAVLFSLLNIRRYRLAHSHDSQLYGLPKTADRPHLIFPDFVIERVDSENWNDQLRYFVVPLFDLLWQSFGMQRTPNVDELRRWTSRS
ncbi:MAG: ATP-binding protein [Pirellulaceae bacterium]|nr:ATP-binding protein [Pirellulaceae bacterium]